MSERWWLANLVMSGIFLCLVVVLASTATIGVFWGFGSIGLLWFFGSLTMALRRLVDISVRGG